MPRYVSQQPSKIPAISPFLCATQYIWTRTLLQMKTGKVNTLPSSTHSSLPSNNCAVTAAPYVLWSGRQKSDQFRGTKAKHKSVVPLTRAALCNNIIPNQNRALALSFSSSSSFTGACFIGQTNLLLLLLP